VKWEAAQDLLLPDLKDCPWPMAQSRLVLSTREFCSRAAIWRVTLDPILSIAGVAEYPDLIESQQMEVIRVLQAFYDRQELTPITPDNFFREKVDRIGSGPPDYMTVEADSIILSPAPGESGKLIEVQATFKPALSATTFPDELWNQYIEGIVEGAKARLYASPSKPYTDLTLAAASRAAFVRAAGIARERASKGSTRARRRIRGTFY